MKGNSSKRAFWSSVARISSAERTTTQSPTFRSSFRLTDALPMIVSALNPRHHSRAKGAAKPAGPTLGPTGIALSTDASRHTLSHFSRQSRRPAIGGHRTPPHHPRYPSQEAGGTDHDPGQRDLTRSRYIQGEPDSDPRQLSPLVRIVPLRRAPSHRPGFSHRAGKRHQFADYGRDYSKQQQDRQQKRNHCPIRAVVSQQNRHCRQCRESNRHPIQGAESTIVNVQKNSRDRSNFRRAGSSGHLLFLTRRNLAFASGANRVAKTRRGRDPHHKMASQPRKAHEPTNELPHMS